MTKFLLSGLVSAAILLLLLATSACTERTNPQPAALSTAAAAAVLPICTPVRIVVMQDQTGSTSWTRTPALTYNDFGPLIEVCGQCGGELAVGLIRDQSNRSLVRVRLEAQPVEPPLVKLPHNRFRAALAKAEQENDHSKFEAKYDEWLAEMQSRLAEFRTAVEPLLSPDKCADRTDIWGAVTRADAFLAEDDASWGQKTHGWAVFLSDGEANVKAPFEKMRSHTKVLVVNGSASLGVFEKLGAIRFESTKAAFDFIVATETQGQK
jgi:hypothetical protein